MHTTLLWILDDFARLRRWDVTHDAHAAATTAVKFIRLASNLLRYHYLCVLANFVETDGQTDEKKTF